MTYARKQGDERWHAEDEHADTLCGQTLLGVITMTEDAEEAMPLCEECQAALEAAKGTP